MNCKRARELLDKGQLEEAWEELERVDQELAGKLPIEEHLGCEVLRSRVMSQRGHHAQALRIAITALNESEQHKAVVPAVDACISMADCYIKLGKQEDSLQAIKDGESRLRSLTDLERLEFLWRSAYLKSLRGLIHFHRSDLDGALHYWLESLSEREEIGNKRDIAMSLNNVGVVFQHTGELERALDYYERSLILREELGHKKDMAMSLINIGVVCGNKGELDEALGCYERSLEIMEELGNRQQMAYCLGNIATILLQRTDVERAYSTFKRTLSLLETIGNDVDTSWILFNLIELASDLGKYGDLQSFLGQMADLNRRNENRLIDVRNTLAEAYVLKKSGRVTKRARAQLMFQEVIEGQLVKQDLTIFAMLNLSEMLLSELMASGDPEAFAELQVVINRTVAIAEDQDSSLWMAEAYLLQSKMALISLDIARSRVLLTKAQRIADTKGFTRLAMKVSHQHDELLSQLSKWEQLIEQNASFQDRLELARLEEMIAELIHKKVDTFTEEPEEAVILLVTNIKSGICMYSRHFLPEHELDDLLLGAFLSAINVFSAEAFATSGTIERIKHKDYTLICKPLGNVILAYVFKGQSYSADQKLDKLRAVLERNDSLMELIAEGARLPTSSQVESITQEVDKLFV